VVRADPPKDCQVQIDNLVETLLSFCTADYLIGLYGLYRISFLLLRLLLRVTKCMHLHIHFKYIQSLPYMEKRTSQIVWAIIVQPLLAKA